MGDAKLGNEGIEPRADEVLAQLERILASESLNLPDRAKRFLQYVVMETLDGRSHYLKAYTIACIVFGRRDFDAQGDPAVRIEAGRIRRELERYYLIAGEGEPIIITIPKGGYVPSFERGASTASGSSDQGPAVPLIANQTAPDKPQPEPSSDPFWSTPPLLLAGMSVLLGAVILAVVVQPSAMKSSLPGMDEGRATIAVGRFDYPADDKELEAISQGTAAEVIAKLVKFNEIVVIDGSADPRGQNQSDARYMLEGGLRNHGDKIRTSVRLLRQFDRAVVWATNYDTDLNVQSALDAETAVAQKVATAVAQPFGVVFSSDARSHSGGWDAYECALAYYNYRRAMTAATLSAAQDCLTSQTAENAKDATSMALLSLTNLDQLRFAAKLGKSPPKDALEVASTLAHRASTIDPQNARVLQALMLSYFFNNDISAALDAGAAAYALNPNDTEVTGEYGLRLSMSGRWETGCELVSKAVNDGAGPSGYYEVGMALCAFMRDDFQAAELWSKMSDLSYNPMHRVVLAAILGASGKTLQARREIEWLNANAPTVMPDIAKQIRARLARPQDQERVFDGLRAAGAELAENLVLK